jgi:hypothetical protein
MLVCRFGFGSSGDVSSFSRLRGVVVLKMSERQMARISPRQMPPT